MIGKFLLTVAVILGAYLVYRARVRRERAARGLIPPPRPLVPAGLIRPLAYLLLAFMLLGSILYIVRDWGDEATPVMVQVVNANTGLVTEYEARRGSLEGRRFVTTDGREIRLAEVERLVVLEAR